ncbi:Uncharacterised protein [Yersinia intermedia]|uniref:hypothetical protein n=1 Tax=Yersinia intermedia TaxID=631 RepID=UPI0005E6128B|nr:hypothetical protein [Yersinia intermedia]CNB97556.1 Uncharacterised protein [Yersinia intermedia]CNC65109.1 Uncharacterised protein [Yersinia intermedia]CNH17219.1 Uncharacterised protein [Yersinia intermedia]CRF15697.1 Uncharacterised protein [Yersinia intermedia]
MFSALNNVPRSGGQSLLDCPDKEAAFAGYNLSELPDKVFADFCNEVVRHAYRKSANEENLIGIAYQEDILSDRSTPSAEESNTHAFNLPITVSGDNLRAS